MPKFVAFLRGINLGGRRVTGGRLCGCFEELGLSDVATFRASGNVVFGLDGRASEAKLAARIEHGLAQSLGYDVPVFLRTAAEVEAIAKHRPFAPKLVESSNGKLQVDLLAAKPTAKARKEVLALATDEDRLAVHGRELYWLPSGGMMDSALDQKALAAALGQTTRRTKGTIELIAEKYFAK